MIANYYRIIFFLSFYSLTTFVANGQCVSSDVTIEIISSPNFIEDSNVETPAGVRLRAAHIGAKFTNTTSDTLVNVFAYVGDSTGTGTPGVYPSKTSTGLVGTFSLTHSANTSDATRFIGTLLPNESIVQYWMIEYPLFDDNGDAVYGACSDETDDLNLDYDFWVSFSDDESPQTNCFSYDSYNSTIRCQITASANKIWPNGDNKVPDDWTAALEASGLTVGWELDSVAATGTIGKSQGIWYDVGNVNKGFDNDGDFVPDYNAWLQPVGDPDTYNPDCYRLVKASGVLLVNTRSQGWKAKAFEDQMYFQNIEEDNTGVVGYVIYEFITIDGPCGSVLSPYQSAASGSNNEKFNADFGTTLEIESSAAQAKIEKSVDSSFINDPLTSADLKYTLKAINTGSQPLGSPSFGSPLIIREAIPEGTVFKSGSAILDSASYSYTLLYSSDSGSTWVTSEPSPASDIDIIEWWLNEPLAGGDTAFVTLEIEVSSSYSGTYGNSILNFGYLSVGQNEPFSNDYATTLIRGTNSIGDTVFVDNGAGDGVVGDGIFNGDETILSGVTIFLYYDENGDGIIDPTDIFYDSVDTDVNGKYLFDNLPDGSFIVQVQSSDITDNVLYPGYGLTTQENIAVTLSGTEAYLEADFGFAPALVMEKSLTVEGDGIEGTIINYDITATNIFSSPGIAFSGDKTVWSDAVESSSFSKSPANSTYSAASIIGAPDGVLCGGLYLGTANSDEIVVRMSDLTTSLKNVDTSTLDSAKARVYLSVDEIAHVDDGFVLGVYVDDNNNGIFESGTDPVVELTLTPSSTPTPTTVSEAANAYEVTFDVTTLLQYGIDKTWFMRFGNNKTAGPDDSDEQWEIDAAGVEFYNNVATTSSLTTTLSPVPMTDSFDITELEYTSATPSPDSIDYSNGILYWDNIGPINAQASSTVNVSFKALNPVTNLDTFTNVAAITNAKFLDGSDANEAIDSARLAVEQRGSISGKLWSEGCSGTSGSYDLGDDGLISAITITLYGCIHDDGYLINSSSPDYTSNKTCEAQNNGTWTVLETTQTDISGEYLFDGLGNGYYYLAVTTADLSTPVQTSDPDATSDNQWNLPGANIGTLDELTLNEDQINVDFGYTMDAIISGYVYEIVGNDTLPVEGVQLTLNPQGTTSSTTSDADGRYVIDGITSSGNYTIDTLLPSGATYSLVFSPETINVSCVGEIVDNQNFGYNRSGTSNIGDTLFFDFDGDGIQDANEEGIDSVNVYIYKDVDEDGIFTFGVDIRVDSVMTDLGGAYLSNDLPSGEYLVVIDNNDSDFPISSSYTYDPDESGICVVCNGIGTVTLDGTTDDLDQDFGLRPIGDGVIGQYVWKDENGDSTKGTLEDGIDSVVVYLYADLNNDGSYSLMDSVYTDSNGLYTFDSLPDGNYKVNITLDDPQLPEEYINSNGNEYDVSISNGQTDNTTLSCTDCPSTMNFGFSTNASIGDLVYWDANGNGTSDINEIGIPNVKVYLLNNLGVKIDSMLTSDGTGTTPAGFYKFTNLPPGTYSIQVDDTDSDLGGASQTADPDSDGLTCGSADLSAFGYPACDHKYEEELIYGSKVISADFGYDPPATFGDYIWNDINGDGVIDNGEPPMEGVALYLCSTSSPCSPSSLDFVDSAVTDYAGEYFFTNIANQTYNLTVSEPAGYTFTKYSMNSSIPIVMAGDTIQSINGNACSDCSLDVDFGLNLSGDNTINGNICIDDGLNDGECDGASGETDLDSVLVYLYKKEASGGYIEFGTTYTNSSGAYTFTDLPNEDYVVSISKNGNPFIEVSELTSTDLNSPSSDIVETTNSIYHNDITLSGGTIVNDADFAFELPDMDFGDLSAGYNVNINENGPRHIINSDWKLGLLLDGESNGNTTLRATGDDNDNSDDEDGITFTNAGTWDPSTTQCVTLSYSVPVGQTAHIVGWIDWGQDYSFVNDMVVDTLVSGTGAAVSICFDVPGDVSIDSQYHNARFRLFNDEQTLPQFTFEGLPQGDSLSGEVEDYAVDLMSATPVPVELIYFKVNKLEDKHAFLSWQTASEFNSDRFEVYKSVDNGQSFSQIGQIAAANNSNSLVDYNFIDHNASKDANTCYTLRQVDFDGQFEWMDPKCLKWDQVEAIKVHPNPASSELNIQLVENDVLTHVELISSDGRIVASYKTETGDINTLNISTLEAGVYFIRAVNISSVSATKVVIQQ